jgi:DNA-binding MarR family transcriptional regulator
MSRPHQYRFEAINMFIRETVAADSLTPSEALVWVAIWTAVNVRDGGLARVPHARLADWTGLSPATTKRAVRRLKALGLVVVVNAGRGRQVSAYRPVPWVRRGHP